MRAHALIIGAAVALFICGFESFNASIIRQSGLIGSFMPTFIFGSGVLFLLILNPLIRRMTGRVLLNRAETAAALAMPLLVCCIPRCNFGEHLPATLMLPFHHEKIYPAWQELGLVDSIPDLLQPDLSASNGDRALNGLITGLGEGSRRISPLDVPWKVWLRPLAAFWLPAFLALNLGIFGLVLVMHRQWSRHEQLAYPIIIFAQALLPERRGDTRGTVFRQPAFLIALGAVTLIHINNYFALMMPDRFIAVKRNLDLGALQEMVPIFHAGGGGTLLYPYLYFSVVALAFFVATDISFSLGIVPYLYAIAAGVFTKYGISISSGNYIAAAPDRMFQAGGFLGIFLFILFAGRRHYLGVARRTIGLRTSDDYRSYEVWGGRLFLAATGIFIALLLVIGIEWHLALVYTFFSIVIIMVMGRVVAEAGVLVVNVSVFSSAIVLSLYGLPAIRPEIALLLMYVTAVLMVCTREMAAPFFFQAFRLIDVGGARVGRFAAVGLTTILLGTAIAIPVNIYWQYNNGIGEAGWVGWVARMPFEESLQQQQKLQSRGQLETAGRETGLDYLQSIAPDGPNVFALALGTIVALGLYWGRTRFPWWPLHPVMLVVLWHWQSAQMAGSILLGCIIKILVMKYGGAHGYQRVKPVMIGIIAGDLVGGVLPMITGTIYFLITGESPFAYNINPNI